MFNLFCHIDNIEFVEEFFNLLLVDVVVFDDHLVIGTNLQKIISSWLGRCVTLRPWTGTKGQVHKGRWSDHYFRGVAVLAALTHPAHWSHLDQLYIFGDHVE